MPRVCVRVACWHTAARHAASLLCATCLISQITTTAKAHRRVRVSAFHLSRRALCAEDLADQKEQDEIALAIGHHLQGDPLSRHTEKHQDAPAYSRNFQPP